MVHWLFFCRQMSGPWGHTMVLNVPTCLPEVSPYSVPASFYCSHCPSHAEDRCPKPSQSVDTPTVACLQTCLWSHQLLLLTGLWPWLITCCVGAVDRPRYLILALPLCLHLSGRARGALSLSPSKTCSVLAPPWQQTQEHACANSLSYRNDEGFALKPGHP